MSDSITWTDAQLKAIETPVKNTLVSAAAGSGKTAVLVERVIRMVGRKENPVDLDRVLVVTFTNAAAANMRRKIYESLKAKAALNPEDEFLRKQLMKVHVAKISTIDSLCLDIVRENFQDVNIDPGFRIADSTELALLRNDTVKELIEEQYQQGAEDFLEFVDYYTDKNDSKLEDLILNLYSFAQSHQEPVRWLEESASAYLGRGANYEDMLKIFRHNLRSVLEEIKNMSETGLRISESLMGPYKYTESFEELIEFAGNELKKADEEEISAFDELRSDIKTFLDGLKNLPRITAKDEVDPELKALAQNIRKKIKNELEEILSRYIYADFHTMMEEMNRAATVAETLVRLTLEFGERFSAKKKDRLIADFSDVAHHALHVLIEFDENDRIKRNKDGEICYRQTADEMAAGFDEIIVDEYQDTNLLQEYILGAISKERFGRSNIFMVGDVKQSIYGFRMAEPGLFNQKYDTYDKTGDEAAKDRLINLDANFRSRKEILDITNMIFEKIMIKNLGGIDYTDGHALKHGKKDEPEASEKFMPEICFINGSGVKGKNAEAHVIADRILKLVTEEDYKYADIAILSRVTDIPQIENVLKNAGIPFVKNSNKGFFECMEIRLAMNLLDIIDNPYQDIPFAAVLHSPVAGLGANELAVIKNIAEGEDMSLYECALKYAPISWFMEKLEKWREMVTYMGICDFMEAVLDDSGLNNIFLSMPDGKSRMKNIDYLKSRAQAFSKGSYVGLYNFIRFIKEVPDNKLDSGKAGSISAGVDAVKLQTIHGSKGLEYPVVFVAGCGKSFNLTDLNKSIILDRNLGIGIEYRDAKARRIGKTLLMETIRQKKKQDAFAEEMRLLYVAITRAQEKIIMTGVNRGLSTKWAELQGLREFEKSDTVSAYKILSSPSYMMLMLNAFAGADLEDIKFSVCDTDDIETVRFEKLADDMMKKDDIINLIDDSLDLEALKMQFGYVYPFKKASSIKAKLNASELEQTDIRTSDRESDMTEKFSNNGLAGAQRGTAYHAVFEHWDYSDDDIKGQLKTMENSGIITEEQKKAVKIKDMQDFTESDLGRRMKKAFMEGSLVREQAFLMGSLHDINNEETATGIKPTSDIPDDEILMVQGVVDAFFEEDGELILVDYKTDKGKTEAELKEIYRGQQEAYAEAIEKIYGKKVKEKYLYSTELGKEIKL